MTRSPSTVFGVLTVSPHSLQWEEKKKLSGCISDAAWMDLTASLIKLHSVMNFHIKGLMKQVTFHVITVSEVFISIYHWVSLTEPQICQAFGSPPNG